MQHKDIIAKLALYQKPEKLSKKNVKAGYYLINVSNSKHHEGRIGLQVYECHNFRAGIFCEGEEEPQFYTFRELNKKPNKWIIFPNYPDFANKYANVEADRIEKLESILGLSQYVRNYASVIPASLSSQNSQEHWERFSDTEIATFIVFHEYAEKLILWDKFLTELISDVYLKALRDNDVELFQRWSLLGATYPDLEKWAALGRELLDELLTREHSNLVDVLYGKLF